MTSDRPNKPQRRYDIDWLRVLLMLAVFLFHNARFFDPFPWHIKNAEQSFGIVLFVGFLDSWFMPMFFLLSGVGSWYGLKSRMGKQYLWERVQRLLVPLYTVGALILLPPQLYWELVTNEGYVGSFWEFYPRYFLDSLNLRPSPFFGSFWTGHLWFLKFLFIVSLLAFPLLLYLKITPGRRWIDRLASWCDRTSGIFIFLIPQTLILIALRGFWRGRYTWAEVFYYLVFFLIGYLIPADSRFTRSIKKHGWVCFPLGVASFLTILYLIFGLGYDYPDGQGFSPLWLYLIVQIVMSFNAWVWVVFILSLGAKYLNFNHRLLAYCNEAVLPFYILHQTLILFVGWYVIPLNLSIPVKYLIVSTSSFLLIMGLYELLVKRSNILRFMFGMRVKSKS